MSAFGLAVCTASWWAFLLYYVAVGLSVCSASRWVGRREPAGALVRPCAARRQDLSARAGAWVGPRSARRKDLSARAGAWVGPRSPRRGGSVRVRRAGWICPCATAPRWICPRGGRRVRRVRAARRRVGSFREAPGCPLGLFVCTASVVRRVHVGLSRSFAGCAVRRSFHVVLLASAAASRITSVGSRRCQFTSLPHDNLGRLDGRTARGPGPSTRAVSGRACRHGVPVAYRAAAGEPDFRRLHHVAPERPRSSAIDTVPVCATPRHCDTYAGQLATAGHMRLARLPRPRSGAVGGR
jgi:hypothetical protein